MNWPRLPLNSLSNRWPHATCSVALAMLCLLVPVITLSAQSRPSSPALAVYDGQPILEDQLPPDLLSQLRRMEQQVYLVRLKGLHELIDKQLIAAEAAKQKVTPQALIQSRIAAVPDPSEQQVHAYYDEHKAAINQPFDDAAPGIRSMLKSSALQSAGRTYTQNLFQEAINEKQLMLLLRPPQVDMAADPKRSQGNADAPVTIVEFSDFSCPYCEKANAALNDLLARHQGQVRVSYRDFPLTTLHPHAAMAAEASRCAGEQDRYWPYHDVLFAHIHNQTREDLLGYARDLKLDTAKFTECLDSGRYRTAVEHDRELGIRGGVSATPAFFVNGVFMEGVQTVPDFEQAIQRAQAVRAGNVPATPSASSTTNP